jgi:hypothetical protein
MSHIKLYEEFNAEEFSNNFYQVERDEFLEWWKTSKNNSKSTFGSMDQIKLTIKKVEEICNQICGPGHFRFEHSQDLGVIYLGLIVYTPDSDENKRIFIKLSQFEGGDTIDFGIVAFSFLDNSKMEFVDELHVRVPQVGKFYICSEIEGLEECLTELKDENFFEKPIKEPKPYKQQQILTDEDFTSRGIDNQMRSKFYSEYGKILRDIPLDLPYEERREKSLSFLDNWHENLQ